jgi:hypothetical protein
VPVFCSRCSRFSIEATAWVSSQADLLACTFALACLLAWVSWRSSGRAVALAAVFVCFVLALLSKESAVVVPPLIALIEATRARKTTRAALVAIGALAILTAAHILFLRPHILGVEGTGLPVATAKSVVGAAAGYATAVALPLPAEMLEMHRRAAALLAAALLVTFALAARHGAKKFPNMAWIAFAAAAIAAIPGLFGVQERYFLIASAGTSVRVRRSASGLRAPGARGRDRRHCGHLVRERRAAMGRVVCREPGERRVDDRADARVGGSERARGRHRESAAPRAGRSGGRHEHDQRRRGHDAEAGSHRSGKPRRLLRRGGG